MSGDEEDRPEKTVKGLCVKVNMLTWSWKQGRGVHYDGRQTAGRTRNGSRKGSSP